MAWWIWLIGLLWIGWLTMSVSRIISNQGVLAKNQFEIEKKINNIIEKVK